MSSCVASLAPPPDAQLLTTAEFATIFRVEPKTVRRWIASRKITDVVRTPTGQIRIRALAADEILHASTPHLEAK